MESISRYKEERKRQAVAKRLVFWSVCIHEADKGVTYREDSKRIFEAHHAQLKAQTIDVLQEKLENKRKGVYDKRVCNLMYSFSLYCTTGLTFGNLTLCLLGVK